MLPSSSTSSKALLKSASGEGLKHLYRTILHQARLLSSTFDDPFLYTSHRYLARKNLESLLSTPHPPSLESNFPPSTATKRLARAAAQRRHLADANFGWEHAVVRSLSLAYGRSGKLRRDALSDFSPQPSSSPAELKHPKELRKRQWSPVMKALLMNAGSMDGAIVKKVPHLEDRPPPPWLPAEEDVLVKVFGRATGRRRVANASRRFASAYLAKVKVPADVGEDGELWKHLESKARPPKGFAEVVTNLPKRFAHSCSFETKRCGKATAMPQKKAAYLTKAKQEVDLYRSNMHFAAHRKKAQRTQGWASHPKDYASATRARRRLYGRLLDDAPLLLIDSAPAQEEGTGEGRKAKNDPLGIRTKLRSAHQTITSAGIKPSQLRIGRSKYAVGRAKGDVTALPTVRAQENWWLCESERQYLQEQGLI